jgi:hypothetical protein
MFAFPAGARLGKSMSYDYCLLLRRFWSNRGFVL